MSDPGVFLTRAAEGLDRRGFTSEPPLFGLRVVETQLQGPDD